MNQKVTPMAKLIEEIESLRNNKTYINPNNVINDCILLCYAHISEEKQMVIDTFAKAYLIGEDEISNMDAEKAAIAYFNQNFKQ
jgi:hypothetical protein